MQEDPVERQLAAYNARDIAAFVPCFSLSVVIEDGAGTVLMRGHDELRERYGAMFTANPQLHCELVHRTRVGSFVIDEERITGRGPEPIRAVAIYRVDGAIIEHVRLLR